MVDVKSGIRCYSADNVSDTRTRLGETAHRYVSEALTTNTVQYGGVDYKHEGAADWRLSALGNRSEVKVGDRDRDLYGLKQVDGVPYRDLICETGNHTLAGVVLVHRGAAAYTQDECPLNQTKCQTYRKVKGDIEFQIHSAFGAQGDPSVIISARSPLSAEMVADMEFITVAGFRKMAQLRKPLCASNAQCNASVPTHVLVTNKDHPERVHARASFRRVLRQNSTETAFFMTEL